MKGLSLRDWEADGIYDGRSTRIICALSPQPLINDHLVRFRDKAVLRKDGTIEECLRAMPPWRTGESFYAKEAHRFVNRPVRQVSIEYRGSPGFYRPVPADQVAAIRRFGAWRPGVHMLEWASRFAVTIVGINAKQLENIQPEDVIVGGYRGISDFMEKWDRVYTWSPTLWVWLCDLQLDRPPT